MDVERVLVENELDRLAAESRKGTGVLIGAYEGLALSDGARVIRQAKARVAELEGEVARLLPACIEKNQMIREAIREDGFLRHVLTAAETAIRDCIRRPMGVEPDSATNALRLIAAALAPTPPDSA